jgi:hypothetical protein
MKAESTHVAYSDETQHNVGRFKGIAVVTATASDAAKASEELKAILSTTEINELKWEKLRTARDRIAVIRVIAWLFGKLNCLRVDVLTWDIEDPRHKIERRDDVANLQRMFYHLMNNALRRYPSGSTWKLYPDEQDSVEWGNVHDILDGAGTRSRFRKNPDGLTFRVRFEKDFRVVQILPSKSHSEPLIQVADILAGMSAFSRAHIGTYRDWQRHQSGQKNFFVTEEPTFSGGEREKCAVLSEFKHHCHKCSLPISLDSTAGLETRNPRTALNFWHYKPQWEADKAPTRKPGHRKC